MPYFLPSSAMDWIYDNGSAHSFSDGQKVGASCKPIGRDAFGISIEGSYSTFKVDKSNAGAVRIGFRGRIVFEGAVFVGVCIVVVVERVV
jgi:hypothetical protein